MVISNELLSNPSTSVYIVIVCCPFKIGVHDDIGFISTSADNCFFFNHRHRADAYIWPIFQTDIC